MNAPLPDHVRRALETVSLDDKYTLDLGQAFVDSTETDNPATSAYGRLIDAILKKLPAPSASPLTAHA